MPQASDANRNRYRKTFPDIGCEHAIAELERRGYRLDTYYSWHSPLGHKPTDEELFWIRFLVEEWDFGGLE